jgi:RNA polymerase sigma factor (sigma-70 family)
LKPPITYTEPVLLNLLRQQSEAGFDYLYQHYSGALFSIVKAIVVNEQAAEDVLQEVFIRIFRKIDQYQEDKSRLYTWMAQIARHAAIDWLRKEGNRPTGHNQKDPEDVSIAVTGIKTEGTDLARWVNKLAAAEKAIVILAYFEGHTQEEISERLQVPLGTVKSRLRSGLKRLRDMMSEP